MRRVQVALSIFFAIGFVFMSTPAKVEAACKTMQASHNGTDMFHETGAEGAAINQLLAKVDQLKIEKAPRKVRMGRVRAKCGPWFQKYLLPHRHCVAKARVCF